MFESDMVSAGTAWNILRTIFSSLDKVFFNLMNIMYQIFFNVATADIFANDMILKFYGRIQVIIGVFMIFQLTMSILKGIVNPDELFEDGKGKTNIIQRIIISLVMLALITPISIPGASNEYEKQINNNGILFGTLYSLQHRVLSNNTLGRLILGVDSNDATFLDSTSTSDDEDSEVAKASNTFTSTIVKTYYKINLIPKEERQDPGELKDDAALPSNRVCNGDIDSGTSKGFLTNYKKTDSDFNFIIDSVNNTCTTDDSIIGDLTRVAKSFSGSEHYMIAYTYVLGGITAIIFSAILLSFSIDVAMRSIKLAILRLIAPIPIISYMNPKDGDGSAFNSWTKTLTSTYLDLFLRLAIIYFAFFLIESLITGGLVINVSGGVTGGLSIIIIFIAIFIFAAQAPKFFKEALGIKADNFSLFGGLGSAIGVGAMAGGTIGSAIARTRASWAATANEDGSHTGNGKNKFTQNLNRGKNILSAMGNGLVGGVIGAGTGVAAYNEAKSHKAAAVLNATNEKNKAVLESGRAGSTMSGRLRSNIRTLFTGESASSKSANELEKLKAKKSALEAIDSRVKDKAATASWTRGSTSFNGTTYSGINYQDFQASYTQAKTAGNSSFQYEAHNDKTGMDETVSITIKDAELGMHNLQTSNENDYYQNYATNGGDAELDSLVESAQASGIEAKSRSDYKDKIDTIGIQIRNQEAKNKRTEANDKFSGNK